MAIKSITGGAFQSPTGTILSGTLTLALSQDAVVSGTGQIAPSVVSFALNGSGNVSGSLWANDQLLPAGTTYTAEVADASGARTWGPEIWYISGSSPIDVGTLIPSSIGVSFPGAPISSVGLTMPSEFTVTGSPLIAPGTISVTKAAETANTVWAGPTSGGTSQPGFRVLVSADLPAGVVSRPNVVLKTAAYPAVAGDAVRADTSILGFTITMPAANVAGQQVWVKKVSADANTLTIQRAGADLLDGQTTQTIDVQYTSLSFMSDGLGSWDIY